MVISEALRAAIRQNSVTFLQPSRNGMVIMTSKLSDELIDEINDWMTASLNHNLDYKVTIDTVLNSYYGVFPVDTGWEQRTATFSYDCSVNNSLDKI